MKAIFGVVLAVLLIGATVMPAGADIAPVTPPSGSWSAISNPSTIPSQGNTGAYIEFLFGPGGAITTNFISGAAPYDRPLNQGADDILVNVYNNSGSTLPGFHLTGSQTDPNFGIFGFDNDGVVPIGQNLGWSGFTSGTTGYEGSNAAGAVTNTFTVGAPFDNGGVNVYWQGDVNFTGGLANGATAWFALESVPNPQDITPSVPEPATMLLLGFGLIGVAGLRRRFTK